MSGGGSGRERRLEKYGLREEILALRETKEIGANAWTSARREELMVSEGVQK
jgi:hypothetical protein